MLGKLMKYEFKATARIFLPFYAALLLVSVINRVLMGFQSKTPIALGIVLLVTLIVGIMLLTLILTLDRFYKNLLQNEGYLMLTLPVNTESLILSKLFVSTIWFIASTVVVVVAISVMALTKTAIMELLPFIYTPTMLDVIQAVVLGLSQLIMGILILYACMSLSLLVGKHRILFSFGAYIAISTVMQIIAVIGVQIGDRMNALSVLDNLSHYQQQNIILLGMVIISLFVSVVMFFITRHMLKNKLNLQ